VIAVIPLANLSQGVNRVKAWTVFWMVVGIGLAAMLGTLISYTITKPIRSLIGQIRKLENNNFEIEIKRFQADEIGHLALAFQRMTRRLNVLVNEVLQAQILRQEAEIGALQSRINPHFMNNVLENFRMMLKRGRTEQVEAGLVSMGQLLRYHASRVQETVPLQAELEFLNHYMHIQQLRFGDRLHFRADIDDDARRCLIPSLLIQPLVENAIHHGQSPFDEAIRIELRARKEPGRLLISIVDEGNGIEEERLEAIMEAIENGRKIGGRIGLTNVYQRLKLMYRGRGTMSIQSEIGLGTRITITIPLEGKDG
jgi:two-component system sensor histidine kinase YesM